MVKTGWWHTFHTGIYLGNDMGITPTEDITRSAKRKLRKREATRRSCTSHINYYIEHPRAHNEQLITKPLEASSKQRHIEDRRNVSWKARQPHLPKQLLKQFSWEYIPCYCICYGSENPVQLSERSLSIFCWSWNLINQLQCHFLVVY